MKGIGGFVSRVQCLLWITVVLLHVAAAVRTCPDKCVCDGTAIRCTRRQLASIPDIPDDTTIIDLRYNHIREVPARVFAGKVHLHTIFLNENQIAQIHADAFNGLPSLKYLYLNSNRIRTLQPGTLRDLGKLQIVYLQQNEIAEIHNEAIVNVPRLERLYLSSNHLTTLPEGVLDHLQQLKVLRLDANPLHCDCSLKWLHSSTQEAKRVPLQFGAACQTPTHLYGKAFSSLTTDDFKCTAPVLMTSPQDMRGQMGSQVVIPCQAVGDPEPIISWMFNEKLITSADQSGEDRIYTQLPSGALRIERFSPDRMGDYRCKAVNMMGEVVSRPARMSMEETSSSRLSASADDHQANSILGSTTTTTVNTPSQHLSNHVPEDVTLALNDSIILHCSEAGAPSIMWFFNGVKLSQSTEKQQILANGTLVIRQATLSDAGHYKCTAASAAGRTLTEASVRVIDSPEITVEPEGPTITPGDSFVLHCEAIGNPRPEIRWTFNGAPIVETNRVYFEADNTELHVEFAKVSEAGEYRCFAESPSGSDDATTFVHISAPRGPPQFAFEPYDQDAFQGSTIEIPCQTQDGASAEVKWKKDGRTLFAVDRVRIAPSGSLFITNVTTADSGRYECSIVNEFGRATASGLIAVKDNEDVAPGEKFVRKAFADAANEIDAAINHTIAALFTNNRTGNSRDYGDMFRIFRFPNQPARELARASEVYERTLHNLRKQIERGNKVTADKTPFNYTEELPREYLELISNLAGCTTHRLLPNCSDMCFNQKYRTIDGTCNNLAHPTWGSSLTGFRRLLPPIYEDDFTRPVGWTKGKLYNGFELPSPRLVSTKLISTETVSADAHITHMVMQWGQFLDHDLDHALPSVSSESFDGVDCKKTCEFAAPCYPIPIPANDPRVTNRRCLDFVRSSAICGSGQTSILFGRIQPREQVNQLTTYIDASQVYGYSKEFAHELRNLTSDDGTLRHGVEFPGQKWLLPFASPTDGIDCRREIAESNVNCFTAGDIRVNEQVGLLAMHTVWFREHNRIAWELKDLNPQWDSDTIYQEARKIVGAQMQHITFQHWLPLIVGDSGMEMLGEYKGYNPNVDSSISNEFATAALRFGHSLINPILSRFDANHQEIPQGHLPLHKAFFAPWRLVYEGGVDPLMRGMFLVPAKVKKPQQNLNTELTERLFFSAHAVALDLAAINIQRSRDHAIPSYNEYRKLCNLTYASDFEDLQKEISDPEVRKKLKEVYGNVNNIDIWVGGILEDQVKGGRVGPLFQCLLVEQFRNLRDGDRFYYENPSVFKPEQLTQIKQGSLARVLCDTSDNITQITDNVFVLPEKQGGFKSCELVPKIDLRLWMECTGCHPRPQFGGELRRSHRARRSIDANATAHLESNLLEDSDWLEMNDERIEGLEAVIEGFQKTLKQMRRKLKKLEESCSAVPKNNHHGHGCEDSNGIRRLNNEIWKDNECTRCECKHRQVNCVTEKCPQKDGCKDPVTLPGQCCPTCNTSN